MKTIDECKDEVAKKYCYMNHTPYESWNDLLLDCIVTKRLKQIDTVVNEAMALYASESQATHTVIRKLNGVFTEEARKHIGKTLKEVPELVEILKTIELIEKYCLTKNK